MGIFKKYSTAHQAYLTYGYSIEKKRNSILSISTLPNVKNPKIPILLIDVEYFKLKKEKMQYP